MAEYVLGVLLPDGKPNHEMGQWKTIPEGAATYVNLSYNDTAPEQTLFRTVAAAFDPRLNGKLEESCRQLMLIFISLVDKPGAYLENSVVANERAAAHSTDPVCTCLSLNFPSIHRMNRRMLRNCGTSPRSSLERPFLSDPRVPYHDCPSR